MFSPLRSLLVVVSYLLAIASLTTLSVAQGLCPTGTPCVTSWHNDLSRTGWQQNETTLTADPNQPGAINQTSFGLLYQWTSVQGRVYAQPLAVSNVPVSGSPNVVFVATNEDMLYAFNATSSSGATIWPPLNLATVPSPHNGTFINCNTDTTNWPVCTGKTEEGLPTPFSYTDVGVTGTPVIDPSTNMLYVVAAVEISSVINYYLIAVDITLGSVKKYTKIMGSVPGSQTPPTPKCTTGGSGTIQSFDINHIQRSGLLLLNGIVYVSFAPLPEASESGWMFGYSLTGSSGNYSLTQTAAFSSTPHGTGGGIWGSGAAPASDGTDILVATGNGTFDLMQAPADNDAGDSLLRLHPPTAPQTLLTITDFFTPYDVFSYESNVGLCPNDEDFGSGGVLLPPNFYYKNSGNCSGGSGCNVAITADKQSNLYVTDQASLGETNFGSSCSGSTNNIQCITTPAIPANESTQGYWGSPAYLSYTNGGTTYHMLYYSADAPQTVGAMGGPGTMGIAPMPINGYQLQPSGSPGPIPSTPTASTSTLFCQYSPTPSVSSSGTTTPLSGIVWAIEQNQNAHNNPLYQGPPDCAGTQSFTPALHAFCVSAGASSGPCTTTALQEIYTSRLVQTLMKSAYFGFPTPTVFNGQVYVGAKDEIEVFGLCSTQPNGHCQP